MGLPVRCTAAVGCSCLVRHLRPPRARTTMYFYSEGVWTGEEAAARGAGADELSSRRSGFTETQPAIAASLLLSRRQRRRRSPRRRRAP